MANQYEPRDWKSEIISMTSRLNLYVLIPNHLTAHSRIRFSCPHGIVTDTTVLRFVERTYCCKSQASKAHDKKLKQKAAMESPGIKIREEHKNLPGCLYFIRYQDSEGLHFKLGITRKPFSVRFRKNELFSIIRVYNASLQECFDIEQQQLKYAKEKGWRYSSHSTTELIKPEGVSHIMEVFSKLKNSPLTPTP